MSEAMIDIRCTLAAAARAAVVSDVTRAALESLAKATFYPERNYASLLKHALELGLPERELEAFREWLPFGKVSQKRADALQMLAVINDRLGEGLEDKKVCYRFENSLMWERMRSSAGEYVGAHGGRSESMAIDGVLDELRLDTDADRINQGALLRTLAINQSHLLGMANARDGVDAVAGDFWQERGIDGEEAVADWMRLNSVDAAQLSRVLEGEARMRWIRSVTQLDFSANLFDELRVSGAFPRLVERARSKQALLESVGLAEPTLADLGLNVDELFRWYFEDRLGRPVPSDTRRYWKAVGFDSPDAWQRALLREYAYARSRPASASGP
jgi:hypothetical protein